MLYEKKFGSFTYNYLPLHLTLLSAVTPVLTSVMTSVNSYLHHNGN